MSANVPWIQKYFIFFCKCRPSSQEVVELVGEDANIIDSFKAHYCKSTIDVYIIG